jgi:hypothetical protein
MSNRPSKGTNHGEVGKVIEAGLAEVGVLRSASNNPVVGALEVTVDVAAVLPCGLARNEFLRKSDLTVRVERNDTVGREDNGGRLELEVVIGSVLLLVSLEREQGTASALRVRRRLAVGLTKDMDEVGERHGVTKLGHDAVVPVVVAAPAQMNRGGIEAVLQKPCTKTC